MALTTEQHQAHVAFARALSAKHDVPLPDDPTLEDLAEFSRALQPSLRATEAKAEEAQMRAFGGPLDQDERDRLHAEFPDFWRLTSDQILAAVDAGYTGDDVVRYALTLDQAPNTGAADPVYRALRPPARMTSAPTVRILTAATHHQVSRPRERRNGRRATGGRASSSGDDGSEPPLAARPCAGCGASFVPSRRDRRHCSPGCRVRAHRARPQHDAVDADGLLERARLAREAVRAGADPLGALTLVVWPPDDADTARRLLAGAA